MILQPGDEVPCACGCGGKVSFESRKGQAKIHRERSEFYLHGHNMRGAKPWLKKPVFCKCGCKTKIGDSVRSCRKNFAPGHFHISEAHKRAVGETQKARPRRKWSYAEKIAWAEKQRLIARRGSDNPAWKGRGGVDPSKALRLTPEYRAWREAVFQRDAWTCQKCLVKGGVLHPHHIEPLSVCPEKMFDVLNGVTLCKKCHLDLHRAFRPWLTES